MLKPTQLPERFSDEKEATKVVSETITLGSEDLTKMTADSEKHIRYVPVSNACGYDLGTVVPKGMAQEMYNALHDVKKQLEDAFGLDLDSFVQDRLQFTPEELNIDRALYDSKTPDEQKQLINDNLCTVFAPEQIDAIALAIYNIEIRKTGNGMIEGDMTGIGKGRVAAAIIRYVIKYLKKTPIFLTEKTYLFSDIYRDLIDISSDTNIPQQIRVNEVRKEIKMTKSQIATRIKELVEAGETKEDAVEMVEEIATLGFEMVPVFETNKKYDEQVKRAKKTRLQVVPFIINDSDKFNRVKNMDGDILYFAQRNSEEGFKSAIAKKRLPKEYNLIMTTYSQLRGQAMSAKMEWFKAMAQDTVVICDESHNASGDSNTGRFLLDCLDSAKAAIFLSATYAKRADNMVIYGSKTSMRETGLPKNDLIMAIDGGGVPLQEIISSQLVAEGQMIRRERTYAGVDVFYNILDSSMAQTGHPEFDMADKHKAIADVFTKILRDIIELQSKDISKWVKNPDVAKKFIGEAYGEVEISQGFDVKKALTSSPMFSRVFNLINQLLFSIKAEAIADRAIGYLKQGKKPVITFANTMESFMDNLTNDEGLPLTDGDLISSDFKRVLEKLLDNIFYVTVKSPTGEKTKVRLDIEQFPIEIQNFYLKIKSDIKQISIGISISPIDVLLKKIREAGFSAEEITGRAGKLNYTDDTFMSATYEKRNKPSATDIFRNFNQNKIDCVLINQSGSTGGSIHATPNMVVNKVRVKYEDGRLETVTYSKNLIGEIVVPDSLEPRDEVKQRVMIILQPELNINTEVQKRGRIFRSGQVLPPMYEYMSTAIPAEKRLQMMLQRKLQSLDSNTSANQKQSDNLINIVDFLNKYGDTLVIKYLTENIPLIHKLGDPLAMWDESKLMLKPKPGQPENAAYRVSGRVAILSISEQEKFYNEISEQYIDYVKMLDSMNEYDLEVKYLDLQATSEEKEVFVVGTGGTSLFGRNSIMERCMVNNLRKPYTKDDLDLMLQEALSDYSGYGEPGKMQQRAILDEQERFYNERIENLVPYYDEEEEHAYAKLEKDEKYLRHLNKFPEEAAKWLATMKASVHAKRIEDYTTEKAEMLVKYNYVRDFLKRLYTGMVTNYVKGEIKVRAVVVGINIDRTRFNPWTAGNIKVKLAIANGVRMIIVPLTNTEIINSLIAETEISQSEAKLVIKQWTKITKESQSDRIQRYIITGNILQAMANENVIQYGRLIKYTTDNKRIRNGILMMDEFNPATGEGRGSVVKIPIRFCLPILDLMQAAKGTRYITTDGIEVTKDTNDLDFIIKVRKNKESNDIILNEDILKMLEQSKGFTDWGTIAMWDPKEQMDINWPAMGATIDRDNMQKFLDYLSMKFNSCLKVTKGVFEEHKEKLGIDFKTEYDDGKEINESESGLASVKIDVNDPLYQKVVEAQNDPVSETGKQVIVVPAADTVEVQPVADAEVELDQKMKKLYAERDVLTFERKLLKLYRILLPFVPEDAVEPEHKKVASFKDEGDFFSLALTKDGELAGDALVPYGELDMKTFSTKEEAEQFAEANGWKAEFEFANGGIAGLDFTEADKEKIKQIIQENEFMDLRDPLTKAGFSVEVSLNDMPLPPVMYTIKKGGHALVILNKRYADEPDFVHGEIAMGKIYATGGAIHHGSGFGIYSTREKIRQAYEDAGLDVTVRKVEKGWAVEYNDAKVAVEYLPENGIGKVLSRNINNACNVLNLAPKLTSDKLHVILQEFAKETIAADFEHGGGLPFSERYSATIGEQEEKGFPVYAQITGYAPVTVGYYKTKDLAQNKVNKLLADNKKVDGGSLESDLARYQAVFMSVKHNDKGFYIPSSANDDKYIINKFKAAGIKIKITGHVNDLTDLYDVYFEEVGKGGETPTKQKKFTRNPAGFLEFEDSNYDAIISPALIAGKFTLDVFNSKLKDADEAHIESEEFDSEHMAEHYFFNNYSQKENLHDALFSRATEKNPIEYWQNYYNVNSIRGANKFVREFIRLVADKKTEEALAYYDSLNQNWQAVIDDVILKATQKPIEYWHPKKNLKAQGGTATELWTHRDWFSVPRKARFETVKTNAGYEIIDHSDNHLVKQIKNLKGIRKQPPYATQQEADTATNALEYDNNQLMDFMWNHEDGGMLEDGGGLAIANKIKEQIGHKALYMLGAKTLVAHKDGLSFRIRGSNKVNYIKITVAPNDTYNMEFAKIRAVPIMRAIHMTPEQEKEKSYKIVAEHKGVYNDMLNKIIEQETGLRTKLFAQGGSASAALEKDGGNVDLGLNLKKYSKAWYSNEIRLFAKTLDQIKLAYEAFDSFPRNPDSVDGMYIRVYIVSKPEDRVKALVAMANLHDLLPSKIEANRITFVPGISNVEKIKLEQGGPADTQIMTHYYHWGEYSGPEALDVSDIVNNMRPLTAEETLGFAVGPEDAHKVFYSDPAYIDNDEDGISVKHAYAIDKDALLKSTIPGERSFGKGGSFDNKVSEWAFRVIGGDQYDGYGTRDEAVTGMSRVAEKTGYPLTDFDGPYEINAEGEALS